MAGPFPGMNPYLERRAWWNQVHSRLLHALAEEIAPRLPGYLVDVEQDTLLVDAATGDELFVGIPDLSVSPTERGASRAERPAVPALAPIQVDVALDPSELHERRHYYLVLRELTTARPVTVIEVLSYANKETGPQKRERFRTKRELVLRSSTHWVEIDLLRAGTREVAELFPDRLTPSDYLVVVSRATSTGRRHEAYPFSVREAIPAVGIPLAPPDPDLVLDLGPVLEGVSQAFGAEKRVSYKEEPVPRLLPADQSWLAQLLRATGERR